MNKFATPRWIVDQMVKHRMGLEELRWSPSLMAVHYNRKIPAFDLPEVILAIHQDIVAGLLDCRDEQNALIRLSLEELRNAIVAGTTRWTSLGLTSHGGERWERLSNADWSKFVERTTSAMSGWEYPSGPPDHIEIVTTTHHYTCKLFTEFHLTDSRPIPQTEVWSIQSPWAATYWKQFPVGYRVDFFARDVEPDWHGGRDRFPDWYQARPHWFDSWRSWEDLDETSVQP